LPSGKLPSNFQYAGRVYNGSEWTPALAAKYPKGVTFTDDGFPDFSPYATHTVKFEDGFSGNRRQDEAECIRRTGLPPATDWTWHHHQDGATMQRIPYDLHKAVRHAGGVAIVRSRRQG
jgi:hypothetical protein